MDIVEQLRKESYWALSKKAADEIERLREALRYCACTCAKSCGKHVEHDGEIAFVECSGWVARVALKESE